MKRGKYVIVMSIMLTGIILLQSAVMATTSIDEITSSEGLVTVSGRSDSGEALTYEVYKTDVENPKFSDIAGFGEKSFSYDNEFNLTFGLKETGVYKICISDGYEKITEEFVYANAADRGIFIDGITAILATPETAAALIDGELTDAENRAVVKTIGIDVDKYAAYTENIRTVICEKIAELGANKTMTEAMFLNIYSEAEILAVVNIGSEEMGGEMIERLNFTFENVQFANIKDAAKKEWIKQAVIKNAPYDSVEDMEEMYGKVCALYAINTAKISNIKSIINKYADLLEITDETSYKKYKKSSGSDVNTALIEDIAESKPYTVTLFLDALDKAADAESSDGSGGGSGGSGGGSGGSGGSGGGTVIKNNFAIEDTEKTETDEKTDVKTEVKFADVPANHWAYNAVSIMQEEGVISGYTDGNFHPNRTVTREEFVKMIIIAFKLEDGNAKSHFHDVFDSDWFYPYVSSAYEKGIVTGDHLGLFGVNSGITRQDATLIATRAMKTVGKTAANTRVYTGFGDEASISDYARNAVKELYCLGKINGTDEGNFEPRRLCTRAEAAMMIYSISR